MYCTNRSLLAALLLLSATTAPFTFARADEFPSDVVPSLKNVKTQRALSSAAKQGAAFNGRVVILK